MIIKATAKNDNMHIAHLKFFTN